jgi:glutamyl/glutaminyl-tRNA synthetase
MNGRYLAALPPATLVAELRRAYDDVEVHADEWWTRLVALLQPRSRTVAEMVEQARPFIGDDVEYDEQAATRHWKQPAVLAERLEGLGARLAGMEEWTEEALETVIRGAAADEGIGAGKLIHPLRIALTGTGASPGIFEVAALLGRERTLHRIRRGVASLHARAEVAP